MVDRTSKENVIDVTSLKYHEDFVYGEDYQNDVAVLKVIYYETGSIFVI